MEAHTLQVCDSVEQIPYDNSDIFYWQSYVNSEATGKFSVSQLVEDNSDRMKSKYLALIYELGESKVNGKRIVDHLQLRPGFSYWWMTLLAEKCNFSKSPQIADIIKMIFFRDWLKEQNYTHVVMLSSNITLVKSMQLLLKNLKIEFVWKESFSVTRKKSFKKHIFNRIIKIMPHTVMAFMWLGHEVLTKWPLNRVGVEDWEKSTAKTTLVSYLFNDTPESPQRGHFESNYWSVIPNLLIKKKEATNWLHIYNDSEQNNSVAQASKLIKKFNYNMDGLQVHTTLSSFISVRLIICVVKDWFKLFSMKRIVCKGIEEKSGYLWPLIKKDALMSMVGIPVMSNLLKLNLFEQAMRLLPSQNRGCYLQENQGWEFGFLHAWQSMKHGGNIIGVPHSTVRYWDLRYFFDSRSYSHTGDNKLPLPRFVGTNGLAAKKMFLNGGFPKDKLLDIEALRYLHLAKINGKNLVKRNSASRLIILVLGSYVVKDTTNQILLLSSAIRLIEKDIQIILKPHPASPIHKEDYPEIQMEIVKEPIFNLLSKCDLVYTDSTTSAAVDAYCAGKQVVSSLTPNKLNMSPLRNNEGVLFVSTTEELARIIRDPPYISSTNNQAADYFYLNPKLPMWNNFLFN